MDDFDRIASGVNRISGLAQLRDKVVAARDTAKRECGNCEHWMKSRSCPAEKNVGGMTRGPSASELACGKFQITDSAVRLRSQRIAEAFAFAAEHDLPTPALSEPK